jgi:asparagine synthase (glutamine-hydrolysing)
MCGIAGIYSDQNRLDLVDGAQRMLAALVHRGPDDEGLAALSSIHGRGSPAVLLGSRRLAIIDLSSSSHQPMSNEDETVWITYNGEVYNFLELRSELIRRGHRFRSNTDTEVVVHGYEEWGVRGMLERLCGMFAFAIWDARAERLVLARDRLGKKPVFYRWDGRSLAFASELRALLESGVVDRRLSAAGLLSYLTLGSIPAPLSIVDGVQTLLPGCALVLERGHLEVLRYWELSFAENPALSEREAAARVRVLLGDAVRSRLVSDVPVGVFLSGGIDSSAIVALAREATNGAIRTFSMVFPEDEFDEGPFARLMARHAGTNHTEHVITADEVLRELPRVITVMDQPTTDGVNTYFVSKVARQTGTVVALSGIGGDELFAGYPSFHLVPHLYRLACVVDAVPAGRWMARQALARLAGTGRLRKLDTLFREAVAPEIAYLVVRGMFLDGELDVLLSPEVLRAGAESFTAARYMMGVATGHPLMAIGNLVSLLELRTYMHNQLLRDTDVMSMAHSVEVRAPFLDHRLVEFVASVPARYKVTSRPKGFLVKAIGEALPAAIVDRPKGTFTFPFEHWFRGRWKAPLEAMLFDGDAGVFDRRALTAHWQSFLAGRTHWSRIWALAVAQSWVGTNLTASPPRPAMLGAI